MKSFKPKPALSSMGNKPKRGGRGGRWHKVSTNYRKAHPVCALCKAKVSVHTHHLKPWHEYPKLRYDYSNLQALCEGCHLDSHHGTH